MTLWDLFINHHGRSVHKWPHYFAAYERHFRRLADRPITFIEIGCGKGGSLQMWKRYFGPHATIVGLDIREECKAYEEEQVHVRIGDQSDTDFLAAVLEEFGRPDAVLDDGSHVMEHMVKTFRFLYPRMVKDGVYMAEDLHTAYWPRYGGGLRREGTFIELCKSLIDELNARHIRGTESSRTEFTDTTVSMHFYDSLAVFERGLTAEERSVVIRGDGSKSERHRERVRPVAQPSSPELALSRARSADDRLMARGSHSVRRIKRIARLMQAVSYLEIGVSKGRTFNALDFPRKVAVDPKFRFDTAEYRRAGVDFFETTSDAFFAEKAGSEKFDIIFIDGLHVFEQAYRDFCNSLKHAHDRTVWVIDDVVPTHELSALPDRLEARRRRREAGINAAAWHGDVYKVMFAIHDFHPDCSFVTTSTGGNPQSIVWRGPRLNVVPVLGSIDAIERFSYSEFLKRQDVMNLRPEDEAIQIVLASIARG